MLIMGFFFPPLKVSCLSHNFYPNARNVIWNCFHINFLFVEPFSIVILFWCACHLVFFLFFFFIFTTLNYAQMVIHKVTFCAQNIWTQLYFFPGKCFLCLKLTTANFSHIVQIAACSLIKSISTSAQYVTLAACCLIKSISTSTQYVTLHIKIRRRKVNILPVYLTKTVLFLRICSVCWGWKKAQQKLCTC